MAKKRIANCDSHRLLFCPDELLDACEVSANDFIVETRITNYSQDSGGAQRVIYTHHGSVRCSQTSANGSRHDDAASPPPQLIINEKTLVLRHWFLEGDHLQLAPNDHKWHVPYSKQFTIEFRVFFCPADPLRRRILLEHDDDPVDWNSYEGDRLISEDEYEVGSMTPKGLLMADYACQQQQCLFKGVPVPINSPRHGAGAANDMRRRFSAYIVTVEGKEILESTKNILEVLKKGHPALIINACREVGNLDANDPKVLGQEAFFDFPAHFHLHDILLGMKKDAFDQLRVLIALEERERLLKPVIDVDQALRTMMLEHRQARKR